MEACIISTAQQASPKVIHISEPVRAQVISSSALAVKNPLSASSRRTSEKYGSVESAGLPSPGRGTNGDGCWLIVLAYLVKVAVNRTKMKPNCSVRSDESDVANYV